VLSFHKYWNFNDDQSIAHILKYRDQYNIPVWLGETGENSNVWFTQAIRLFEKNNIGWSWWPLKKLGYNNPLQVRSNLNYDALVDYWNGKASKPPKESNVYSGLLEFATYTKFESNIIHRDVVDAMIRQPFDYTAKSFKENKIAPGTTLYAVDYDLGANGIAYYDKDTANYRISTEGNNVGNRGDGYRNDGVDIYKDNSHYNRWYVGHTEEGEWLQYTINIKAKTTYTLQLSYAGKEDGELSITDGNASIAKAIKLSATGDETGWKTVDVKSIAFTPGVHHLRVLINKGGFNFSSIRFLKTE